MAGPPELLSGCGTKQRGRRQAGGHRGQEHPWDPPGRWGMLWGATGAALGALVARSPPAGTPDTAPAPSWRSWFSHSAALPGILQDPTGSQLIASSPQYPGLRGAPGRWRLFPSSPQPGWGFLCSPRPGAGDIKAARKGRELFGEGGVIPAYFWHAEMDAAD